MNTTVTVSSKSTTPNCEVYKCIECKQKLPKGSFPRKLFSAPISSENNHANQEKWVPISQNLTCKFCRKTATAKRCQQPLPKRKKEGKVAESGTTRRPNNFGYCNYVDKLFGMNCFRDIVLLDVFNSAKDVSESMGALQAALRHGNLPPKSRVEKELMKDSIDTDNERSGSKVLCLVIGDGNTPRTAVLASFLTRGWDCVSIDPALTDKWKNNRSVDGMLGYQGTLEEFVIDSTTDRFPFGDKIQNSSEYQTPVNSWEHIVMLCVHSHARFRGEATVDKIRKKFNNLPTTIVSLPCCPRFRHIHDIGIPPHKKYQDDCVFSACRTVDVWNFMDSTTLHRKKEMFVLKNEEILCKPIIEE